MGGAAGAFGTTAAATSSVGASAFGATAATTSTPAVAWPSGGASSVGASAFGAATIGASAAAFGAATAAAYPFGAAIPVGAGAFGAVRAVPNPFAPTLGQGGIEDVYTSAVALIAAGCDVSIADSKGENVFHMLLKHTKYFSAHFVEELMRLLRGALTEDSFLRMMDTPDSEGFDPMMHALEFLMHVSEIRGDSALSDAYMPPVWAEFRSAVDSRDFESLSRLLHSRPERSSRRITAILLRKFGKHAYSRSRSLQIDVRRAKLFDDTVIAMAYGRECILVNNSSNGNVSSPINEGQQRPFPQAYGEIYSIRRMPNVTFVNVGDPVELYLTLLAPPLKGYMDNVETLFTRTLNGGSSTHAQMPDIVKLFSGIASLRGGNFDGIWSRCLDLRVRQGSKGISLEAFRSLVSDFEDLLAPELYLQLLFDAFALVTIKRDGKGLIGGDEIRHIFRRQRVPERVWPVLTSGERVTFEGFRDLIVGNRHSLGTAIFARGNSDTDLMRNVLPRIASHCHGPGAFSKPLLWRWDGSENILQLVMREEVDSSSEGIYQFVSSSRTHLFEIADRSSITFSGYFPKYVIQRVRFVNEAGADVGGLTREFFACFGASLIQMVRLGDDDENKLFKMSPEGRLQFNPYADIGRWRVHFFTFGVMLGMSLVCGYPLGVNLELWFVKRILDQEVTLEDLAVADPEFARNLQMVLDMSLGSEGDMGITMTRMSSAPVHVAGAQPSAHELLELVTNGADVNVTDDNKAEFVRLTALSKMGSAGLSHIAAIRSGLASGMNRQAIALISAEAAQGLWAGYNASQLTCAQLRKGRWTFSGFGHLIQSRRIERWFWAAVESFSGEQLSQLLLFVTGLSALPATGAEDMSFFVKCATHLPADHLPEAHTCFYELVLPLYANALILKEKLTLAIEAGAVGYDMA